MNDFVLLRDLTINRILTTFVLQNTSAWSEQYECYGARSRTCEDTRVEHVDVTDQTKQNEGPIPIGTLPTVVKRRKKN